MKRAKLVRATVIFILISAIVVLKLFTTVLGKPVFIYIRDLSPDGYPHQYPALHRIDDIDSVYATEEDLDKIKYCKNLKRFWCFFKLENLSIFENQNLEELYIEDCSNLSELKKFSGLKVLDLRNSDTSDLSYIISLHELNTLHICTSNDLDCENINQLKKLEKLYITCNSLNNFQSVTDLPKLSYLWILVNDFDNFDISFIKQSGSIKELHLRNVPEDKQQSIIEEFEGSGIEVKFI
ncbi:hypothetical protein [uncultured Ruminococcus sp.]|uniref:hypothetical protein n=1 Tax=uncultured Ruminococcus sp. TaxID=165186 RepID=UPI000EF1026D|nr:hypothetical protein [uncultured Ruminococcus sp.]HCJ40559.1 hypothetical protein [Ruminococcus sp.]